MSFGCKCSCFSPRMTSNFNSNVLQGGIYPHIKFEKNTINISGVLTSSGSTGGRGVTKISDINS